MIQDKSIREFNNAKFFDMNKFINLNSIEMNIEDDSISILCAGRKISVSWNGGDIPELVELLEYLVCNAYSVDNTKGIDTWLDSYSDILQGIEPDKITNEIIEVIYRDCINDYLRLKYLLGEKPLTYLFNNIQSHRVLH
jgi:hypothetical protein